MQPQKNRHKKKMTSWRDSAMRSTCLPELDGRPWLLSTATVRLLMPPHQVLASGRSVQGDSTAGSDPPAAPRVTAKPTALAQGEPGRWASGQLPAGGAGPPGRPSLPGRDPGASLSFSPAPHIQTITRSKHFLPKKLLIPLTFFQGHLPRLSAVSLSLSPPLSPTQEVSLASFCSAARKRFWKSSCDHAPAPHLLPESPQNTSFLPHCT